MPNHAPTPAERPNDDRSAASRAYASRATDHIEGGDVVGYGAFLFLSSSTLSDSIEQKLTHKLATQTDPASPMLNIPAVFIKNQQRDYLSCPPCFSEFRTRILPLPQNREMSDPSSY